VAKRNIVVVGTSAGGIEALRSLVKVLPKNFPAAVFVVMHTGPDSPGVLTTLLHRSSQLIAVSPNDNDHIEMGHIYVAPADHHMLVEPGRIRLSHGPKENRFRPAIDPLFRSAAQIYGPKVIGVVLTGGLDDGTAGLWAIKQLGGTAVVQDPNDALFPSMPISALTHVKVDYRLPVSEIGPLLIKLIETDIDGQPVSERPQNLDLEVRIAKLDPAIDMDVREIWEKSSFTCPECHGVLLKLEEGRRFRFRCHTGHAFSGDSLLAQLTQNIEEQLWSTVRSIEESVILMRHLATHYGRPGISVDQLLRKADEAEERARIVRRAIATHEELNIERVEEEVKA
jgi:two-component system chemotaxis response regulator CheB